MKYFLKFTLLATTLTIVGCNEKAAAPDVGGAGSTTGVSGSGIDQGTIIAPPEYYIKVNNTSSSLLKHHMHKTGSGNARTACEVKNASELSSENYRANQSAYDITCFFEAEELSLYVSGFNMQVEASQNTCDFVAYSPYGYYNRQPGSSSTSMTHVKCMNDTTSDTHVDTAVGATDVSVQDSSGTIGCEKMVDTGLPLGTRKSFAYENDEALCHFNYPDNKCDVGVISIKQIEVTYTPPTATAAGILKKSTVSRRVNCGGNPANCVKGPIKLLTEFQASTRGTAFYEPELNTPFFKEYQFPGLIDSQAPSNIPYVNYRRDLASKHINYVTSDRSSPAVFTDIRYRAAFGNATNGKTFDGSLMEAYSRNVMMDGSVLIDPTYHDTISVVNNEYTARPLAAEPFIGLGAYSVNPYYSFYCLDTAMDIKARIKIVVRDWDRTFSVNSEIEWLSDIWKTTPYASRMDIPGVEEVDNDPDRFNPFNDREDLDDKIEMVRTFGSYGAASTVWSPKPETVGTINYTDGFFNPNLFPNE